MGQPPVAADLLGLEGLAALEGDINLTDTGTARGFAQRVVGRPAGDQAMVSVLDACREG